MLGQGWSEPPVPNVSGERGPMAGPGRACVVGEDHGMPHHRGELAEISLRFYVLTTPFYPPAPDRLVGVACDSWISNRPLYPVIGVGSFLTGRLSFGQHRDAPFVFDVGTWPRLRHAHFASCRARPTPLRHAPRADEHEGFLRQLLGLLEAHQVGPLVAGERHEAAGPIAHDERLIRI
jgi:hypothetical protein